MYAEFFVELATEDPVLEIPWSSDDGSLRFYDLRAHPELISQIPEAVSNRVVQDFLLAINSRSTFFTAKCDVWFSREMNPEEEIFGTCKFGSYVDLVPASDQSPSPLPSSFHVYEALLKNLVDELRKEPDIPASVELTLRRCYQRAETGTREGFYITAYVVGYGNDEAEARSNWVETMKATERALMARS